MERIAAERQHAEDEGQNAGFFEVEAFEERCENSRGEKPESDVVGRMHTTEQGSRQNQQPQADHTAGQMGCFHDDQRQEVIEGVQPFVHPWRCA
jgi:hypothetical protein